MTSSHIERLPQKPPFRFVEEIESVEFGAEAVGAVTFPAGHSVFEGHLPDEPLVPGVILIEALAQLSGIVMMGPGKGPAMGYLAAVHEVRFRRRVLPDDRVVLRSRLERRFGSAATFRVVAEVEGEKALTGTITIGGMHYTTPPSTATT